MRAANRIDVDLRAVPFPSLRGAIGIPGRFTEAGDLELANASGILVRMMPAGSLEQVVYRMDALHRLQRAGVPVLNPPRAVEASVDKYLALGGNGAIGLARARDDRD